jgi:hypothetical protein
MTKLPHTGPARADAFIILGVTREGRQFRPSDWAERLCGVMSCFRPSGSSGPDAHLKFSPHVHPTVVDGVKAVVVNNALGGIAPLAHQFVVNFARDNDLQVVQGSGAVSGLSWVP